MHPNAHRSQACLLQYRDRRQLPTLPAKCAAPTSGPRHDGAETLPETETDDATTDTADMYVENRVLKAQLAALHAHNTERNIQLTLLEKDVAALRVRSIAQEAELRVLRHLMRRKPVLGSL